MFNIEGGCYAKAINLSAEKEPEIYNAIRFGTVLENVVFDPHSRAVDYHDTSLTQNTRAAYPIEHIPNAKIPCVGGHPNNIIFLTADAFGALPPVSRLTPEQAMYHFISGYTAKVAGTEMGVNEPQATFSACFGAAFLVWHPSKYAELLAEKMRTYSANAWLVNTGWSGGPYGIGSRIKLKYTRAIIDAIHSGELANIETIQEPIFGMEVPTTAAYVICVSVAGPALIQLGLDPLQAHLFVFWFALLSTITPPVCGAVFIAAGMVDENWLKVALTAMALGVGLYLIPLGIIANPMIIELAENPIWALITFIKIAVGLSAVSYGLIGYRNWPAKVGSIASGLLITFV